MTYYACFVDAELPKVPGPALQQQFTKYAVGETPTAVKTAVERWCDRIGLRPIAVKVVPALTQDPSQYDAAQTIEASPWLPPACWTQPASNAAPVQASTRYVAARRYV